MNNLSVSNWIQIFSIVASLVVSVVSVWIASRALEETKKAAEATKQITFEANRPYVTIYSNSIDTGQSSTHKFFLIKNFGKSAANIEYVRPTKKLDERVNGRGLTSLQKPFVLAPGMVIKSTVNSRFSDVVAFEVKYTDSQGNIFDETYEVNFGFNDDMRTEYTSSSDVSNECNTIVSALNVIAQQIQN